MTAVPTPHSDESASVRRRYPKPKRKAQQIRPRRTTKGHKPVTQRRGTPQPRNKTQAKGTSRGFHPPLDLPGCLTHGPHVIMWKYAWGRIKRMIVPFSVIQLDGVIEVFRLHSHIPIGYPGHRGTCLFYDTFNLHTRETYSPTFHCTSAAIGCWFTHFTVVPF